MRKAFIAAIFVSVFGGCEAPRQPIETLSTTSIVSYKYTSTDASALADSQKAAETHCKEYGKKAELESVTSLNRFTSLATFRCEAQTGAN
jgi:hypothetical protein